MYPSQDLDVCVFGTRLLGKWLTGLQTGCSIVLDSQTQRSCVVLRYRQEAAWMPVCSSCAKFCLWNFFKNDICKWCIKRLFFQETNSWTEDFFFPQSFVVVWLGFFSLVTCIFFGVSLFFLAPWCVLVEKKNQTPNAFSASGGLGYANLSWIAEELITLAYSSHTKETDLSSLPSVCLLRNSVLGWQYKAKWRKNEKPALSKVRERGVRKEKALLVLQPNKLLTAIFLIGVSHWFCSH